MKHAREKAKPEAAERPSKSTVIRSRANPFAWFISIKDNKL